MAPLMAEVHKFEDRKATKEEQAAFDGKPSYARKPIDWEAREEAGNPPPRTWAIDQWLGHDYITLLAGLGGIGKSVVSQQMATALALGMPFVGNVFSSHSVLFWAGEDDEDEIDRRQVAICAKFSVSRAILRDRLFMHSMRDVDCTLVDSIQGGLHRTSMLTELREQVGDYKAEVVILDNIAKLFGGNENDRHQVSAFLTAVSWALQPTRAAGLLLGHVAKQHGSEYSGSTAWENAVRARLWFTDKPPDQKDEDKNSSDEPVTDLRYLSKRKVNYTARDLCTMRHTNGAYDIIASDTGLINSLRKTKAKKTIVSAFARFSAMGIAPTESTSSPNYLPKLVFMHKLADGSTVSELRDAMIDLLGEGIIKRDIVGRYEVNRRPRYGLVLVHT